MLYLLLDIHGIAISLLQLTAAITGSKTRWPFCGNIERSETTKRTPLFDVRVYGFVMRFFVHD